MRGSFKKVVPLSLVRMIFDNLKSVFWKKGWWSFPS